MLHRAQDAGLYEFNFGDGSVAKGRCKSNELDI